MKSAFACTKVAELFILMSALLYFVLKTTAQYWEKKRKLTPIISISHLRFWGFRSVLYDRVNFWYVYVFDGIITHHPASSPLCDPVLVEIKCVCVRRYTTVFSNCCRNQLHVSAFFWVGPRQVVTRSLSPILDVYSTL
jgi:hypothetical protein